jgi:thioredoxin-like negative regulator of GroEL
MSLEGRAWTVLMIAAALGIAVPLLRSYFGAKNFPDRFDRRDVGVNGSAALIVEFTSPYCYECKEALPLLKAASRVHSSNLAVVDARERPDLANKYGIRATPTILVVDKKGRVTSTWNVTPPESELEKALQAASS